MIAGFGQKRLMLYRFVSDNSSQCSVAKQKKLLGNYADMKHTIVYESMRRNWFLQMCCFMYVGDNKNDIYINLDLRAWGLSRQSYRTFITNGWMFGQGEINTLDLVLILFLPLIECKYHFVSVKLVIGIQLICNLNQLIY